MPIAGARRTFLRFRKHKKYISPCTIEASLIQSLFQKRTALKFDFKNLFESF